MSMETDTNPKYRIYLGNSLQGQMDSLISEMFGQFSEFREYLKNTQRFGVRGFSTCLTNLLRKNGNLLPFQRLKDMPSAFTVLAAKLFASVLIKVYRSETHKSHRKTFRLKSTRTDQPFELQVRLRKNEQGFFVPQFKWVVQKDILQVRDFFVKEMHKNKKERLEKELEQDIERASLLEVGDDPDIDPLLQNMSETAARNHFKNPLMRNEIQKAKSKGFIINGGGIFEEFCSFLDDHLKEKMMDNRERIVENYTQIRKAMDVIASFSSRLFDMANNMPIKYNEETDVWEMICTPCADHCLPHVMKNLHVGRGRPPKKQL